jgi:hypothetical protein
MKAFALARRILAGLVCASALGAASLHADTNPPVAVASQSVSTSTQTNAPAAVQTHGKTVVDRIEFTDIPLAEVVKLLRKQFGDEVDIIPPHIQSEGAFSVRPDLVPPPRIWLDLRHVGEEEIFEALNEYFHASGWPFHWNRLLNGKRQTEVLVPNPAPKGGAPKPDFTQSVIYAGDITGPRWSAETIASMIEHIVRDSTQGQGEFKVRVHPGADIIVVSGTVAQVALAREASEALAKQAKRDSEVEARERDQAMARQNKQARQLREQADAAEKQLRETNSPPPAK